MKSIGLLGATGSVGTQTLEVIRQHPDQFRLNAMAFGENIEIALPCIKEFQPKVVAVKDESTKNKLQHLVPPRTQLVTGLEGIVTAACDPDHDIVVNAVLGSIGLMPTVEAIKAGKDIALANKETLVTAGHLVMELVKKHNVNLIPVDSEHSAIFQSMNGESTKDIDRIILTASGGSFRDYSRNELAGVTVENALNHPNWSMGAKITVDSATMMNKGLEVIEAHWLFDMPYEKIDVVIHKESIVHSLVEYIDRSVIAELGHPDMKGPIQYALTYPHRLEHPEANRLNLWEVGTLNFLPVDYDRFYSLKLAFEAGQAGGSMPTVLNAANEVAVQHFLNGNLSFLGIEQVVSGILDKHDQVDRPDLDTVLAIDQETRRLTEDVLTHNG